MASVDLRKRLLSLKNMTQDLRNSTQTSSFNLAHIRSLISNLKQVSQDYPNQSPSNLFNDSRSENELTSALYESESPRQQNSVLFKPKKSLPKQQASHQQEIIALRQENLHLEQQLSQLRIELAKRQQFKNHNHEVEQKKLPYFKQKEALQVFVCRFEIDEQQYSKVEYRSETVSLELDRVIVPHKEKGSVQQFDLTTLQKVEYLSFNVVLYHFQEFINHSSITQLNKGASQPKRQLTHIFVKYDSTQQLKKWDLSMYINFQLIMSLNQKQLFSSYFLQENAKRDERQYRQKWNHIKNGEELSNMSQKWLLQEFRKKRQQFIQIKNLIQQRLNLPRQNIQNSSLISNDQLLTPQIVASQQKKYTYQPTLKAFGVVQSNHKLPSFPEVKQQDDREPREITLNANQNKISQQKNTTLSIKREEGKQFQVNPAELNQGRSHAISFSKQQQFDNHLHHEGLERQNSPSISHQPSFSQTTYSTAKPALKSVTEENRLNRSDSQHLPLKRLSVVQQKITTARKNLQQGYNAVKYSKDGFSPHEKRVFLSLDCKKLCWSQKDRESEYKSIPLEVIIKVDYGVTGEGIAKHVKKFEPLYYCVIEYYTGDYKKKTIELKGESPQQMKAFAEELRIILDYSKGISLNALVAS